MNPSHGGNLFAISRQMGWDWRETLDFSASINPLGPSPKAIEAIRRSLDRIAHYPEPEPEELARALARAWKIEPEQILLGNGATELLHFFARVLCFEKVTLAIPVFSEFHRAFPKAACVPVDARWPRRGLLVVTQPTSPLGNLLDLEEFARRTTHPLLVDESFLEFTGAQSIARLLGVRPNLYVLRSLTKFHALAGLRLGALLSDAAAIARLRKRREPWQVNTLAAQAALAALADAAHAARTLEYVRRERAWLSAQLETLEGVHPQPSAANFLLVALDYPASNLIRHLRDYKILVRDCTGWPGVNFKSAIRLAVRTRKQNQRLIEAWREFRCGR